jgi:predicted HD phosphohydrolase
MNTDAMGREVGEGLMKTGDSQDSQEQKKHFNQYELLCLLRHRREEQKVRLERLRLSGARFLRV